MRPEVAGVVLAAAITVGLVPLARVAVHRATGHAVARTTWLVASAFAVSFVADVTDLLGVPGVASQVYLVSQGALFALALARRAVVPFVAALAVAAGVSVAWRGGVGPDWLLHTVAFGGVAWFASRSRRADARVVAIGCAWLAATWLYYVYAPGWPTWGAYQGIRLALAVGWCYVVARADS